MGLRQEDCYEAWRSMIRRCQQRTHHAYHRYGQRGIAVCKRWKNFWNFVADMGARPPGKTLERIDNNKGYEPANCKWATWKEQQRNRRDNRILEHDGRRMTMVEWAEAVGLNYKTLKERLTQLGWSVEKSLTTPARTYRKSIGA
jgi:hypothetical protein